MITTRPMTSVHCAWIKYTQLQRVTLNLFHRNGCSTKTDDDMKGVVPYSLASGQASVASEMQSALGRATITVVKRHMKAQCP